MVKMSAADFKSVPVVDVSRDNISEVWPGLQFALKKATFIAMDLEMSGIGNRKTIMAKSIDDRYTGLSEVAKTRSVLSMGLSCFCANNQDESDALTFKVHTYNIIMLCEENYIVEPISLKFLVEHGFDFNKQYEKGVFYHRGEDKPDKKKDKNKPCLRNLFEQIVINEVPVVLHNALVDLIFLYQNLYTQLPAKLNQFTADLCELFPGGIYDTKYVTEFMERYPASYLEYVFRKNQKENLQKSNNSKFISIEFPAYPSSCNYIEYIGCSLDGAEEPNDVKLCECFAHHGWCHLGKECPDSHDIDAILQKDFSIEENKKRKRNRRKRGRNESNETPGKQDDMEHDDNEPMSVECQDENSEKSHSETDSVVENKTSGSRCEGHRAGFDAFMTGFTMAAFILKYAKCLKPSVPDRAVRLNDFEPETMMNQIYLSGKDYALQIKKSDFSKPSKSHREKFVKLKDL